MKKREQGMNWIRKGKRLAIYFRDGMQCAYCGATIESGAGLTLDHLTPYSLGGKNHESNLVTCCQKCNSARGNRNLSDFAEKVAGYLNHGVTGKQIENHISDCISRDLKKYKKMATEMISNRSSWADCLK